MNRFRKTAGIVIAALMLAACLAAVGCSSSDGEAPAQPVVSYANVPEAYWDLFDGGSFDADNVWTTDDERFSAMAAELKAVCESKACGSVIVATDDKVLFAGGFGDTETDGVTPLSAFTTYEIGSVTKQFTAAAIMQQVEQGKLSVDDTLDKFFPDYENGARITVDHLLHMDSGIEDFLDAPQFFRKATMEERESFTAGEMPDETVLNYLYKTRQNMEPGTAFYYCNTNYWLLALILEQVSGQTYEEYIAEHIFDVCNMPSSTCCEYGNMTSVPREGDYHTYGRCSRGAGDIHSSVCDMLRWDRALFGGKLVGAEQMDYITTMRHGYSCGWMSVSDEMLYHTGSTDSYIAANTVYNIEGIGRVYVVQLCSFPCKVSEFMPHVDRIIEAHIFTDERGTAE